MNAGADAGTYLPYLLYFTKAPPRSSGLLLLLQLDPPRPTRRPFPHAPPLPISPQAVLCRRQRKEVPYCCILFHRHLPLPPHQPNNIEAERHRHGSHINVRRRGACPRAVVDRRSSDGPGKTGSSHYRVMARALPSDEHGGSSSANIDPPLPTTRPPGNAKTTIMRRR